MIKYTTQLCLQFLEVKFLNIEFIAFIYNKLLQSVCVDVSNLA